MSRLRPRRPSGDQARKQAGMEAAVEPPAAETSRPKKRTGTSKYDFVKVSSALQMLHHMHLPACPLRS
jgi:hypothetical protein